MTRSCTLLIGALLLAGCDKAPTSSSNADAGVRKGAGVADPLRALRALPPGGRSATLFRAISDTQPACSKVVASAYQQDYKQMAMFVARCPEAEPYAVFVGPDGTAQARACATLGADVPACNGELVETPNDRGSRVAP